MRAMCGCSPKMRRLPTRFIAVLRVSFKNSELLRRYACAMRVISLALIAFIG